MHFIYSCMSGKNIKIWRYIYRKKITQYSLNLIKLYFL